MTKRQLIDRVMELNETAKPEFLARFDEVDLNEYLNHLLVLQTPRLSGEKGRYDRYFANCPSISVEPRHIPAEQPVEEFVEAEAEAEMETVCTEPVCEAPAEEELQEQEVAAVVAVADSVQEQPVDEYEKEPSDEFTEEFSNEYEEYEEFEEDHTEPVAVGAGVVEDSSSFAENTEESENWLF